jgi:hypothetical protein
MRDLILVLVVLTASLAAQTVALQSVVVSGNQATVTYSKDFATCAHLMLPNNTLVHTNNVFCTSGTNVAATLPLSEFNSFFQLGVQVKLCHGNNYGVCSALVTITVDPSLTAAPTTISLAAGGVHALSIGASPLGAGATYLVAGSTSGTVPGFFAGPFHVALNPDGWFDYTIQNPNVFPLSNTLGVLGAGGTANAAIIVPPNAPPVFAGVMIDSVVGIVTAGGVVVGISAPVTLTLVP